MPVRALLGRLDHLHDRQVEFGRELEISRVVRRYGHDGPRAITDQYVVGDPDRDRLLVDRVPRVRAGENTSLLLCQLRSFKVALGRHHRPVGFDGGALPGRGDPLHQFVLRRQHHVRRAEGVSGRVVNTTVLNSELRILNSTSAPCIRPIQFRCISLRESLHSRVSRSARRRSA
jgi:hypothetical protein